MEYEIDILNKQVELKRKELGSLSGESPDKEVNRKKARQKEIEQRELAIVEREIQTVLEDTVQIVRSPAGFNSLAAQIGSLE